MFFGLLSLMLSGLVIGAIARMLMPGRVKHLGCFGTIALGVGGSLIGGTLANLVFNQELDVAAAGFIGSIIGACLALYVAGRRNWSPNR